MDNTTFSNLTMKVVTVGLFLLFVSINGQVSPYSWVLKLYRAKIVSIINQNISEKQCALDLRSLLVDGISKSWAIQMLDASAKFNPGLLHGNFHFLGNFDQCLSINENYHGRIIKGQYCTALLSVNEDDLSYIKPYIDLKLLGPIAENAVKELQRVLLKSSQGFTEKKNIMIVPFGLCFPQSCSRRNLKILIEAIANSLRIPLQAIVMDDLCVHKGKPVETKLLDIFIYCFFFVVFLLVLASTLYDVCFRSSNEDYLIFSAYSNLVKLVSPESNNETLTCLSGLKVICCLWIILGHTCLYSAFISTNPFDVITKWSHQTSSAFVWNSFYAVDSFFTINGLLISYMHLKHNFEESFCTLILFYLKRFIRLTPAMLAVIFLHTSVLKLLADGPYGHIVVKTGTKECYNSWWQYLFYFVKFPEYKKCTQHFWFLYVDGQLYLFAPLIVFFIKRHPKPVMTGMLVAFLTGVIYSMTITITNRLDSTIFGWSFNVLDHLYISTLHRVPSWLVGVLTGYLIHCQKVRIPRALNVLLLTISFYTMIKLIVNKTSLLDGEYNVYRSAAWNSLAQPTWSLALCFIIYSCSTKNGGVLNDFLSHHVFRVMGRLSYSVYLIHVAVLLIYFANMKETMYFNNFQILFTFAGLYVIILPCALLLYLGFEAPIVALKDKLTVAKIK